MSIFVSNEAFFYIFELCVPVKIVRQDSDVPSSSSNVDREGRAKVKFYFMASSVQPNKAFKAKQ